PSPAPTKRWNLSPATFPKLVPHPYRPLLPIGWEQKRQMIWVPQLWRVSRHRGELRLCEQRTSDEKSFPRVPPPPKTTPCPTLPNIPTRKKCPRRNSKTWSCD